MHKINTSIKVMGKEVFEKTKSIGKRSKSIIFFPKGRIKPLYFSIKKFFP